MKTQILFVLPLLISIAGATPQEEADIYHRDFQTPVEGIALGEISGETNSFGIAGVLRADGPAVDPDTLFEIGSITKTFTGILLADAVLKGKVTLKDPITKYLPSGLLAKDSPLHSVTLLDLATHTSGLPRLPGNLAKGTDPLDPYAHYSVERLQEYLRDFQETDFENRGEMSYSNLGMGLLGHLLAEVSGKSYEVLLQDTLLDPLRMKSTFVQRRPGDVPAKEELRFATGHAAGKPVSHWHIDALCGAGAIVSSARDMLIYAKAFWAEDTPESLREAFLFAAKPQRNQIGLAWFVREGNISHDGGTGGFRSELSIDVPNRSATVKLISSTTPPPGQKSEGDFSALHGYWKGNLDTGDATLRLVLRISNSGGLVLYSLDQGTSGMPAGKSVFSDGQLSAVFNAIGGSFQGKLEGDSLTGTWKQGSSFPLRFSRLSGIPDDLKTPLGKHFTGDASSVAGYWSGYLGGESGLFVILEIDAFDGVAEARLYSPDQTPEPMMVSSLSVVDSQLKLTIKAIEAEYSAKLDSQEKMSGAWKQGPLPLPLTLKHSEERPERK